MEGTLQSVKHTKSICIFNNWGKKEKKYCVVIPTYRRANLLGYTIDSVLTQESFTDFEILIADNNPDRNDETERMVVEKYHQENIAYYKHSKNLGAVGNWNKLILLSRAKYLVMLHDDDMLYPDYFKNADHVVNTEKDIACLYVDCMYSHIADGNLLNRVGAGYMNLIRLKYSDFALWNSAGPPCGMIFRRDVAIKNNGFNPHYHPIFDLAFHTTIAKKHNCFKLVQYPLACYRWLDNDTLKPGVLEECFIKANTISAEILRYTKNWIPQSIKKRFLRTKLSYDLKTVDIELSRHEQSTFFDRICFYIVRALYRFPMKYREKKIVKKYRIS